MTADIGNQKFTLSIEKADILTYNGEDVSIGDYITTFSRIMTERGNPLSYSVKFKGVDWITIESDSFPAAIIIALFASPLKIKFCPYYIVGNDYCAFSNNPNLKFYIPELRHAFRNMYEIEKVLSQKGINPKEIKVIVIEHLDPVQFFNELPQCRIGNCGIYNDGAFIIENVADSYLSENVVVIKDPIDEVFYRPVWESLSEIYSDSDDPSKKSEVDDANNDDEDVFIPDDEKDDVFRPDFELE